MNQIYYPQLLLDPLPDPSLASFPFKAPYSQFLSPLLRLKCYHISSSFFDGGYGTAAEFSI
jgi:hypothetical protein